MHYWLTGGHVISLWAVIGQCVLHSNWHFVIVRLVLTQNVSKLNEI